MSNRFHFRVRAPNGTQKVVGPMPSSTVIQKLQEMIINEFDLDSIEPACIQIKYVFPPPQIISECPPSTTLSSLKLTSGNLIISLRDAYEPPQRQQTKQNMVNQKTTTYSPPEPEPEPLSIRVSKSNSKANTNANTEEKYCKAKRKDEDQNKEKPTPKETMLFVGGYVTHICVT